MELRWFDIVAYTGVCFKKCQERLGDFHLAIIHFGSNTFRGGKKKHLKLSFNLHRGCLNHSQIYQSHFFESSPDDYWKGSRWVLLLRTQCEQLRKSAVLKAALIMWKVRVFEGIFNASIFSIVHLRSKAHGRHVITSEMTSRADVKAIGHVLSKHLMRRTRWFEPR